MKLKYGNPAEPTPFIAEPLNAEEQANQAESETRFEQQWVPKSDKCRNDVTEIINRLLGYENFYKLRQRDRKPEDQKNFERNVTWLVCAMIERELSVPWGWLSISLSHRHDVKTIYHQSMGQKVSDTLSMLGTREMGFAEIREGTAKERFGNAVIAKGKLTTFRARDLLKKWITEKNYSFDDIKQDTEAQTIILKAEKEDRWDKGEWIEYEDNQTTRRWREQLKQVNEWLADADIQYRGAERCNPSRRVLKRYFNNKSFEQGGRLFGAFWLDLKRQDREQNLRISGESIADLDFAQSQPRLLYARMGLETKFADAYAVPALAGAKREGIKKVLNSTLMVNARPIKLPHGTREFFPKELKNEFVLDAIEKFHAPIAGEFYKRETGLGLQFLESEVLLQILLRARENGIVALPMHDGIMVPRSRKEEAKRIMLDAYRRIVGKEGNVTVKFPPEE